MTGWSVPNRRGVGVERLSWKWNNCLRGGHLIPGGGAMVFCEKKIVPQIIENK